jgi:cell wall-associated NlpC family hydrolase
LVIGSAARGRRFAPAPSPGRPALARASRLKPGAITITLCLFGAAICAAFLLSSGVGALAAVPTALQPVQPSGSAKVQVGDLTSQASSVQAEIDQLDDELEGYTESFNGLQVRLTDVNTKMSDLRRQLSDAQKEHTYRVHKFENRIVAMYKSGGDEGLFSVLLDSNGLADLINRVRVIASLADQDRRLVDKLNVSAQELDSLLQQIDDTKAQELAIRDDLGGQQERIQAALAIRETTLAAIDSDISAILATERERQLSVIGPVPKTGQVIVDQLLETAMFYQGIPYVWAGDRPATGLDCSGFTAYVYRQHGVSLPHYSGFQARMGYEIMPENIQAGDLLAFGWPVHHVGIYLGNGLFIHAPRTGDVVKISELSTRHDLAYIRRFDIQLRVGAPAVW